MAWRTVKSKRAEGYASPRDAEALSGSGSGAVRNPDPPQCGEQHVFLTRINLRDIICIAKGSKPVKSYSSQELVRILEADGWYEVDCRGDDHQYKHPVKKGRVTVPHPKKDIPIGTLKSIEKQSGIKFA
jgi:predicted RNA binding protein YcfA (HicA-like mRNA interferase family)